MWTINSEMLDRVPVDFVENSETHERKRGSFDCERIAQAFADYLNEREGDGKTKNREVGRL